MKLLLTSTGWATNAIKQAFLSLLPKPPHACSVLLIACIESPQEQEWTEMEKEELHSMGIEKISVYNLLEEKTPSEVVADVLCVCGGNTFIYLDRLRKTGMDQVIKKAITSNQSIYVGISAGSIIAGPDIEIAGIGNFGDVNEIHLQDLKGFGLTDTAVFPHYTQVQEEEVKEFQARVSYPIVKLTDDEALKIIDDHQKIISL